MSGQFVSTRILVEPKNCSSHVTERLITLATKSVDHEKKKSFVLIWRLPHKVNIEGSQCIPYDFIAGTKHLIHSNLTCQFINVRAC